MDGTDIGCFFIRVYTNASDDTLKTGKSTSIGHCDSVFFVYTAFLLAKNISESTIQTFQSKAEVNNSLN